MQQHHQLLVVLFFPIELEQSCPCALVLMVGLSETGTAWCGC